MVELQKEAIFSLSLLLLLCLPDAPVRSLAKSWKHEQQSNS
jgi:hypothetical protein